MTEVAIVIPNWNGLEEIGDCLSSLETQTVKPHIIVVDNGSEDGSIDLITNKYKEVELISLPKNIGFSGGVNKGISRAIESDYEYIALLNNDAVADKKWLEELVKLMDLDPNAGIATSKIMDINKTHLDSTGDIFTSWGLAYPRGRGEKVSSKYDNYTDVFSASGGASLYRSSLFREVGLFDDDFFAYYEDVDISFRARLAGWKVVYVPKAKVYHKIGATSGKIKGFTTYHTIKNYPWLIIKNVPKGIFSTVFPRFILAYLSFVLSAVLRGQGIPALKGLLISFSLLPKKLIERRDIQRNKRIDVNTLKNLITYDLPPNAKKLRALRRLLKVRY